MLCDIVNGHRRGGMNIKKEMITPFQRRCGDVRKAIDVLLRDLPMLLERQPPPPAPIKQLFTCFPTEEDRQVGEKLLAAAREARDLFDPMPTHTRHARGGDLPKLLRQTIYHLLGLDPAADCPEGAALMVLHAMERIGYATEETDPDKKRAHGAVLTVDALQRRFRRDKSQNRSVLGAIGPAA
jgi:hypothetical protein